MDIDETPKYLTEKSLVEFCIKYIDSDYVHNKKFLHYNFRPDYVSHNKRIVVEFDGYLHYTKSITVSNDLIKDKILENENYKIIRIPYFIQLSKEVIKNQFNLDIEYEQNYQHGFIDKSAILPADFCSLGIIRYKKDLIKFNYIKKDIIKSLNTKIENGMKRENVFYQKNLPEGRFKFDLVVSKFFYKL